MSHVIVSITAERSAVINAVSIKLLSCHQGVELSCLLTAGRECKDFGCGLTACSIIVQVVFHICLVRSWKRKGSQTRATCTVALLDKYCIKQVESSSGSDLFFFLIMSSYFEKNKQNRFNIFCCTAAPYNVKPAPLTVKVTFNTITVRAQRGWMCVYLLKHWGTDFTVRAPHWRPALWALAWGQCTLHNLTPRCVFLLCSKSTSQTWLPMIKTRCFPVGEQRASFHPALPTAPLLPELYQTVMMLSLSAAVKTSYSETVPLTAWTGRRLTTLIILDMKLICCSLWLSI